MISFGLAMACVTGLSLTAGAASLQDEGQVLELPSDWRAGEKYPLELVKERRKSMNGVEQPTVKVRMTVDVEVLKKREEGYVFRWTYGPAKVVGAAAAQAGDAEAMLSWMNGLRLDFEADASGTPTALTNREEVRAFYDNGAEAVWKLIERTGRLAPPEIEKFKKAYKSIMESQFGELVGLREPTLFYMATGASLKLGKVVEYEDKLPNPFGGEPFPSKASFVLKKVDREKGEALIEWKQTLDPEKTPQILLKSLKEKIKEAGGKELEEGKLPRMEINDRAEIIMDLKTGWPRSMSHERTAEAGPGRQVDRSEFKRLAPRKND